MSFNGTIKGRIQPSDPELRYTASGDPVCSFSVVTDRYKKGQNGAKGENVDSTWWRVTCWGTFGENIAEMCRKGDMVILDGQGAMREYDKADGSKGQSLEFTAWDGGPNLKFQLPGAKSQRVTTHQPVGEPSPTQPAADPWATAPPF